MKYLKKFESPDKIIYDVDGYTKTLKWTDNDAIGFGYSNNKFYITEPGKTHSYLSQNLYGNPFGRINMEFAGRLWLSEQIISFWKYPNPDELQEIIHELESKLDISMEKDNIFGEWTIEILLKNDKINRDFEIGESIFIPINQYSNYYNGIDKENKNKNIPHLMNTKEKEIFYKNNRPKDFGSDLKSKKNPIEWEQAKRLSENILSYKDYLILENRKEDLEKNMLKI